jgi:two-component system sensor histidine kinase UhpB
MERSPRVAIGGTAMAVEAGHIREGAPRAWAGVGYLPLFWRLFIPNATVLAVASVVLIVQPANGRIVVLAAGLVVMLGVNLVLMRRAFAPLARLTTLTERVDPLRPGERLPLPASQSEVTVLTESFNAMLDRLEDERRESARRALSEREAERRRLAGELHDELGQRLTATLLAIDRMEESAPAPLQPGLRDLRRDVLGVIEDVRGLARQLRPEALDTLGLVPALTNLVERIAERTPVQVARSLTRDLPPLGDDEELVLFRVAQESLTNAIRHAGAAHIEVRLEREDGCVVLRVHDDGRGLPHGAGLDGGIRTMRERAVSVGGQLDIASGADGTGTEVRLKLPARAP